MCGERGLSRCSPYVRYGCRSPSTRYGPVKTPLRPTLCLVSSLSYVRTRVQAEYRVCLHTRCRDDEARRVRDPSPWVVSTGRMCVGSGPKSSSVDLFWSVGPSISGVHQGNTFRVKPLVSSLEKVYKTAQKIKRRRMFLEVSIKKLKKMLDWGNMSLQLYHSHS